MEIYTVQSMDKYDYDFSVEIRKHGAYQNKEDAIEEAKERFKKLKLSLAKELVLYSDDDDYPDEDSGRVQIEADNENGYYRISFGYQEDYECHSIAVDKWKLY